MGRVLKIIFKIRMNACPISGEHKRIWCANKSFLTSLVLHLLVMFWEKIAGLHSVVAEHVLEYVKYWKTVAFHGI